MFHATNPENAAILERLHERLAALPIGGILTYEEASKAADGRDITAQARYLLTSATEKAEKELGCIFECVRTVGIKRMSAAECPDVGLASLQRIRKAAKRGKKRLDRLNSNSLAEPEQRKVVAYRAMLGAVSMIADGRRAGAIAVVADPAKPIPPGNVLDMFRT